MLFNCKGLENVSYYCPRIWGFLPKGKLIFSESEAQGAEEKVAFLGCPLSNVFSRANQNLSAVASQLLLVLNKAEREDGTCPILQSNRLHMERQGE